MILALNGGGNETKSLTSKDMFSLFKSLEIKNLLIVPLAIKELNRFSTKEAELKSRYLSDLNRVANAKYDSLQFHLITFNSTKDELKEKIDLCDAIYFCGGRPLTLLKRLKSKGIQGLLSEKINQKKLKLLSGGSAGAMILGEKSIVGHKEIKQVVDGLNILHGFIIDVHFSNRNRLIRLQKLLEDFDWKYKGLGIDEDTTVIIDENYSILKTLGSSKAIYINKKEINSYGPDRF
jgi:cyanophycinase